MRSAYSLRLVLTCSLTLGLAVGAGCVEAKDSRPTGSGGASSSSGAATTSTQGGAGATGGMTGVGGVGPGGGPNTGGSGGAGGAGACASVPAPIGQIDGVGCMVLSVPMGPCEKACEDEALNSYKVICSTETCDCIYNEETFCSCASQADSMCGNHCCPPPWLP